MPNEKQTIDGPIPLEVEQVRIPKTPEEIAAQEKRIADLERELAEGDSDE